MHLLIFIKQLITTLYFEVDRVLYSKTGLRIEGTLHLTAHHIIFKHGLQGTPEQEIWASVHFVPLADPAFTHLLRFRIR